MLILARGFEQPGHVTASSEGKCESGFTFESNLSSSISYLGLTTERAQYSAHEYEGKLEGLVKPMIATLLIFLLKMNRDMEAFLSM